MRSEEETPSSNLLIAGLSGLASAVLLVGFGVIYNSLLLEIIGIIIGAIGVFLCFVYGQAKEVVKDRWRGAKSAVGLLLASISIFTAGTALPPGPSHEPKVVRMQMTGNNSKADETEELEKDNLENMFTSEQAATIKELHNINEVINRIEKNQEDILTMLKFLRKVEEKEKKKNQSGGAEPHS